MVAEAIKNQIEKIEYREKQIFWILFSLFVFFLVLYGFLVNQTIMNVVYKQKIEKQLVSLNTEINTLNYQYLEMKNSITKDFALSKGYVNITNSNFAYTSKDKTSSLSLNKN